VQGIKDNMFFYAIGNDILSDISQGLQKEWLITNGLGSFASSTITGCNTRRYHGLLVASPPHEATRLMTVSKLEESITIDNKTCYLSTNKYVENYVHPRGFLHLQKFQMSPFPKYYFTDEGLTVTKEIFMVHGANTTVVRYKIFSASDEPFEFEVNPLLTCRDFHTLQRENDRFSTDVDYEKYVMTVQPFDNLPVIRIKADGMDFKIQKNWYKRFQLEKEKERGLDYIEDLFHPGCFICEGKSLLEIDFIITIEDKTDIDVNAEYSKTINRLEKLCKTGKTAPCDPEEQALLMAADMHLIKRQLKDGDDLSTIIAGYPWFEDWGRDTFISLAGLTLVTKRFKEAENILNFYRCQHEKGLIANRFEEMYTVPICNTVDTSLWYINAIWEYIKATEDYDFVKDNLYKTCTCIIDNYEKGTGYGVAMDEDYLISAGEEGIHLTWMDAVIDETPVTPRNGKPVEINALWYNALCVAGELAEKFDDTSKAEYYKDLASKVKESFNKLFWHEREGYLYDIINSGYNDSSVRPNQVFAISLPFPVLDKDRWKSVVRVVFDKLYIPFGLRTLNQSHPRYEGYYSGPLQERVGAYHMGTAWGYLLGPFIEAFLKSEDFSQQSVRQAENFVDTWMGNLYTGAIGTLNEVFDGEEPFDAKGCVSQAWSVAEALRIKHLLKQHKS
jgi:predicted glycogen debranching enzyme